jgi:Undecaprenyl-phosphate galactose phosphotransferase WbaP
VPNIFGVATVGVEPEDLDSNVANPWQAVKRVLDVSVATISAVIFAPVFFCAAFAIRLDSPGPVFFLQDRIGRGRRLFRCVKFRTMHLDAEERLWAHLERSSESRLEWERFAKLKSFDPRVTRVGRILRRLSLDELPQLLNVFARQMSLVGPRPYLPSETERMGDSAETILKARPGISGLWQVSGRNKLTFEQRLRLDKHYVRNWSLWMDVVVLVKTPGAVIRGDGAY